MRKLLVILLLLASAVVGTVFLVPYLVNESLIRDELSRQLSNLSGSDVKLGGPVAFTIYPDMGISAEEVTIGGAGEALSVSADRTVASVNLFALLSGQVRITEIRLDSPDLVLGENTGGEAGLNTEAQAAEGDVFETVASYLDRFSIDRLLITDGTLSQSSSGGIREMASDVNLALFAPGADQPASITFTGNLEGRQTSLEGQVGSLRELLNRQPTAFSVQSQISPAPHPLIAKVGITGNIELAQDGSYRVGSGVISLAGQPVGAEVLYRPGDRPYVKARVIADRVVFDEFTEQTGSSMASGSSQGVAATPEFAFARGIDADIELRAGAIQSGDAMAEQVYAIVSLKQGRLETIVSSQAFAGGTFSSELAINLVNERPDVQGYLNAASIEIASLAKLAAVSLPVTGTLSSDLQFAFLGLEESSIRNTFNLRGRIDLKNGVADVPALDAITGSNTGRITGMSATASVDDIRQPVKLATRFTWNGEQVRLEGAFPLREYFLNDAARLQANIRSAPVSGSFAGNVESGGKATGALRMETASLSKLLRWVGSQSETSVGKFAYVGDVAVGPGAYDISNAKITLDETTIGGRASVRTTGRTSIEAKFSAGLLDLNKLTGADSSSDGSTRSQSEGAGAVDLAFLRNVDAQVDLDAKQLVYGGITLGPVSAAVAARNGVATVRIPSATLYDGLVSAELAANAARSVPSINAKINLQNVNTLPLLRDASGFDRLEGRLNSTLDLAGAGATTNAVMRSLSGAATVGFSDGAIRGVDVAKLIRNLQSVVQAGYQENPADKTEFTELGASFNIQQGVARTEDLRLLGPLVRMDGAGNVDLGNQTIDMRLNPKVVGSLSGQGGEFDVAGLEIPLIVSGPLAKPRVYPDLAKVLQNPQAALQTLSKLTDGLKAVGISGVDPGAAINRELDKIKQQDGSGIVGTVLENLGNNSHDGTSGPAGQGSGTGELVGSLIQGVLQDRVPGLGSDQELTGQNPLPDGADGQQSEFNVPVPTPNPRKGGVVSASDPVPQNTPPADPARRIVEEILPEEVDKEAGDLINNIFNRIAN